MSYDDARRVALAEREAYLRWLDSVARRMADRLRFELDLPAGVTVEWDTTSVSDRVSTDPPSSVDQE